VLAQAGVRDVFSSAGDPALFTGRLHEAGMTVVHVVGSLRAAMKAVDAGVDALVVEGVEGGGFKSALSASTMVLLPLVSNCIDLPIIAPAVCATHAPRLRRWYPAPREYRWARACWQVEKLWYTAISRMRLSPQTIPHSASRPSG
jgi:hypothetical protein